MKWGERLMVIYLVALGIAMISSVVLPVFFASWVLQDSVSEELLLTARTVIAFILLNTCAIPQIPRFQQEIKKFLGKE